jgi:hypothetical protein
MTRFVLDQHAWLDLYSVSSSSLKQQSVGKHVAPLKTHNPNKEPTSLISLRRSNTYQFYSLVWPNRGSNSLSTALEARTQYLPHSRLELTIYRTRGSNSQSTALEARTHHLPHSRLELTIYRTRGSNSLSTVLEARTHYLPNSRLELTIYRTRGSNSLFTVLEASTLTITPPMRFPCWK